MTTVPFGLELGQVSDPYARRALEQIALRGGGGSGGSGGGSGTPRAHQVYELVSTGDTAALGGSYQDVPGLSQAVTLEVGDVVLLDATVRLAWANNTSWPSAHFTIIEPDAANTFRTPGSIHFMPGYTANSSGGVVVPITDRWVATKAGSHTFKVQATNQGTGGGGQCIGTGGWCKLRVTRLGGLKGDAGAQGPTGPTGATGSQGAPGAPGAAGPQGPPSYWVDPNAPPSTSYLWIDTDEPDVGAFPPQLVTSLPASPVDGSEVYYLADATNGVVWHLRYRAASTSPYKWERIGGAPLWAANYAQALGSPAAIGVNYALPGTPSLVIPLAGDYLMDFSISSWGKETATAGLCGAYFFICIDGTTRVSESILAQTSAQYDFRPLMQLERIAGMAAGKTLSLGVQQANMTGTNIWSTYHRRLRVEPVRVG